MSKKRVRLARRAYPEELKREAVQMMLDGRSRPSRFSHAAPVVKIPHSSSRRSGVINYAMS
jgi:hypothetical protein